VVGRPIRSEPDQTCGIGASKWIGELTARQQIDRPENGDHRLHDGQAPEPIELHLTARHANPTGAKASRHQTGKDRWQGEIDRVLVGVIPGQIRQVIHTRHRERRPQIAEPGDPGHVTGHDQNALARRLGPREHASGQKHRPGREREPARPGDKGVGRHVPARGTQRH